MSEDRRFPLSYDEINSKWDSGLFHEHGLCETGCGRPLARNLIKIIFCEECSAAFGRRQPADRESYPTYRFSRLREPEVWLDMERRKNLGSGHEVIWSEWL